MPSWRISAGARFSIEDGRLSIDRQGKVAKLVEKVDQVAFVLVDVQRHAKQRRRRQNREDARERGNDDLRLRPAHPTFIHFLATNTRQCPSRQIIDRS